MVMAMGWPLIRTGERQMGIGFPLFGPQDPFGFQSAHGGIDIFFHSQRHDHGDRLAAIR